MWWAELPPPWSARPLLLVHRDAAYGALTSVLAAEVTRTVRDIPSCVLLTREDGMPYRCEVNLDNLVTVPVSRLLRPMTALRAHKMEAVDDALRFVLALG